ncbi:hypothetical protein M8J77_001601 [Diaphorina citri]|nr:hypothetical protein M8J77_001601 [Diaphorina citri]
MQLSNVTRNRHETPCFLEKVHGDGRNSSRIRSKPERVSIVSYKEAFHRHCDGVAPTYVIVTNDREPREICGGFSDVPWGTHINSKGHYIPSEKAFLFTLCNGQGQAPTKFEIIKKPFAICYHPDCGPIFGAGADLLIASHCNTNMDSYSNLPHSYNGENASSSLLMGDYNFAVQDYEVFTPISK